MKSSRAVSQLIAVAVIVIVIVAGVGGYAIYALGTAKASVSTVTSVSTATSVSTSISTSVSVSTASVSTSSTANLVALAQAEGTMTIYGTVDSAPFTQFIVSAFQQSYPWAKINYLSDTSGNVLNRALAEAKSGAVVADVVEDTGPDIANLANSSALQAFVNPIEATAGYPSTLLDPNNLIHPFDITSYMLIYNKNLVSNSSLPTSWSVLANPVWKGKIAIDDPARLGPTGGVFAFLRQNMNQSAWITFLNEVKANQPLIASSSGAVYTDVQTGQAAIGIGAITDVISGLSVSGPVNYVWLNPIPVQTAPLGIMKNDPHPYMAQLFVEWAASYAGQVAVGTSSRTPALPAAASVTILPKLPIPIPSSYTEDNYVTLLSGANQSTYVSTYTSIFGS